ncbi:MAG: DUF4157 domain-containing protein [Pseudomonadota bacterium]
MTPLRSMRSSGTSSRPASGGSARHPLSSLADGSARVTQLRALQRVADGRTGAPIQRAAMDEEPMQGKFDPVQRMDEEEPMQGKFDPVQRMDEEEPMQGKFAPVQRAENAAPNNTGMPDGLKSGIEGLSGMDLSDVRVHRDSPAPAQVNALAYAQGSNIHLGPGQDQHLPHEAWHVVQQRQGRVPTTTEVNGVPVNDSAGLEREADMMGQKAVQTVRR